MSDNFRKEFQRTLFCRSSVKSVSNGNANYTLRYTSHTSPVGRVNTATQRTYLNSFNKPTSSNKPVTDNAQLANDETNVLLKDSVHV